MFAFHSPDIVASSFASLFRSNLVIGAVQKFASYLHVVFQSDEVPLPHRRTGEREMQYSQKILFSAIARPRTKIGSAAVDEVLEEAAL